MYDLPREQVPKLGYGASYEWVYYDTVNRRFRYADWQCDWMTVVNSPTHMVAYCRGFGDQGPKPLVINELDSPPEGPF